MINHKVSMRKGGEGRRGGGKGEGEGEGDNVPGSRFISDEYR